MTYLVLTKKLLKTDAFRSPSIFAKNLSNPPFSAFFKTKTFLIFFQREKQKFTFSPFKEKKGWMMYSPAVAVVPCSLTTSPRLSAAFLVFRCFCACGRFLWGNQKGGVFCENESPRAPLYYFPRFAHIYAVAAFFLSLSF